MEAALKAAGKTAEFVLYPGAPHAFNADYRPSYRSEAAKDAWSRFGNSARRHPAQEAGRARLRRVPSAIPPRSAALISLRLLGRLEVKQQHDGIDEEVGQGPAQDQQGPQRHVAIQPHGDPQGDGQEGCPAQ